MVAGRVSRGRVLVNFYVYDTTSTVRQVDTGRVERIEANGGDVGSMCYAMIVHGRGACVGMKPIRGTEAGGSRVGRTCGRNAHQHERSFSRAEVTTVCGAAERGLAMERGCAYGKGHRLQVGCARLGSAKRGRKTEVHRRPEIAPRTENPVAGQQCSW